LYPRAAQLLASSTSDVPFALFYRHDAASGGPRVAASVGLEPETVRAVDEALRERVQARLRGEPSSQEPIALAGELAVSLPGGPAPEPATHVFLAEVAAPVATGRLDGLVVFGLSPRLPFDNAYHDHLLQIAEHLASALSRMETFRIRAAAEAERRNLLLQAPIATALLSGPEHLFELANPLYVKMVGREVVGKTYAAAFPELRGTSLHAILDRVCREGEPYMTDELLVPLDRRGDGTIEECFFKFNLEPLRESDGSVYGMMAVAVDMTESVHGRRVLEKTYQEREQLLAELASANRAKDEFLAMLGHELRNPLSPIVTALQLMKLRSDGRPTREEEVIERQVTHLIRLVDDLLDVSKITRGKIDLKKETVEIADVLAKAVEISSVLFEQRNHQLLIDVPRKGLRWYGDPVRLAQVVANLLTNAARYTEPGGRIELTAVADGHEVVISVRDNGTGIAADVLPSIFEMFVQAKRSFDRAEGGLGLGLTLVKTLVEMHGGTVVAMSEGLGKGSEFVIRLPGSTAASSIDFNPPPGARSIHAGAPRRVLVVDDNEDAADLLAETLRFAGHEVTVAHDPLGALAELAHADPEVAVLDIGLPVMDGYELASRVRQAKPDCRLVALTGYGQDHDVARSKQAGFEHHLVKPVDVDELLRIVSD
ncbi:MAG: ATP-binding protein, partial [Caldimonas sp.]